MGHLYRRRGPKVWIVAIAAAMALVAAACGGNGDEEPLEEGEPQGDLSVVINWTGSELEAFEAVVDGFEQEFPDVNVELVQIPFEEMNAQIPQQFTTGSPPDVTVGLPGLMRLLVENDFLAPVDDVWDQWIEEGQYTESLREVASVDGTAYGVWFKANVNSLVWYRPATLEDAGVEVPETWDDFTSAMDDMRSEGVEPIAVGGADQWPLTQWADSILATVGGGRGVQRPG